ncbi:Transcription factor bHLH110 [Linum grandiflorum]
MICRSSNSSSTYHNYHHQLIDQSSKDDYSWPPPAPAPPSLRSLMNLDSFDANELLLSKIKDEMPDAFPKLRDMNMYSNNNNYFSSSSGHHHHHHHHDDNDTSSNNKSTTFLPYHVMPSVNVLTSDLCSSLVSSSLDLNLRANHASIDHYGASTTPSHTTCTSRNSSMQMMSHHFMGDSPSHSSNNKKTAARIEAAVSVGKKSKRPISSFSDQSSSSKNTNNTAVDDHKKKRSASRPSCPPLKVRKEKLGDRIAALQRLVAPYGKTDTASVLTEAIGYIQFLHDQVQTLSVPYMRSTSNNKPTRTFMLRSSRDQNDYQYQHQHQHQKEDLKSRGLCLVPQSFASYFNGYNLGI